MCSRGHGVIAFVVSLVLCAMSGCGGGGGGGDGDGGNGTTDADTRPDAGEVGHPGTLNGIVTDIGTGARVSGATVSGGGMTTVTDAQGQFTLTGLADGDVNLAVEKESYAPGFGAGRVGDNATAVLVALKQQGAMQPYDPTASATLSELTEAGPYAVIFEPDSLDTSDPNLMVSITPLDPTKERPALPGTLVTGGDGATPLIPVTFAEFTILDSSGNRVQLKPAASAIVELPIPPPLRAAYPLGETIHCYAYIEATGQWEDFVVGTVRLSSVDGTSPVLVASVRHFSWYGGAPQGTNCVDVYVSVVSAVDGRPLGNARVEATPGTVAYTDADGSAKVVSAIGNTSSTFTAYQTGYDVDGSLTGIPGAKYIEFGKVEEELVGLVQMPCSGAGGGLRRASDGASADGEQNDPLVIQVGILDHLLYEVNGTLTAGQGGSPGSVAILIQGGVPGEDSQLENPLPASGANVTITRSGGTPVTLTELAPDTGYYSALTGLTITAGESYTLTIDADGNGSVEGTSTVVAVGTLAWVSPTNGASVAGDGLTARWSDTGTAAGNAAYAPVYLVTLSSSAEPYDAASFIGTGTEFEATSAANPGSPLAPGSYSGSLMGFSGVFASGGGGVQVTNNVTGVGVSGMFYSVGNGEPITFTVR